MNDENKCFFCLVLSDSDTSKSSFQSNNTVKLLTPLSQKQLGTDHRNRREQPCYTSPKQS